MNFLDRLLGRPNDPTLGWGTASLPLPDFDFSEMRFGKLGFGDAFEAAAFLGRPQRFRWTQADYCELLYASGGFQLDFDRGKFAYAAFFIGPDRFLPKHPALKLSNPRLRGATPDGIALSRDTDRGSLERLFGVAGSVDAESGEVILYYTMQGVTMEFEMEGNTERLKRWNLYPK